MVFALADGDFGTMIAEANGLSLLTDSAVGEGDSLCEGFGDIHVRFAVERRDIGLVHVLLGREHPVGIVAVVGQDQQTGGVLIEPSRGKNTVAAVLGRQQVEDGFFTAVLGRGYDAGGFIEHIVHVPPIGQGLSVQRDKVIFGVDLGIDRAADDFIYGNAFVADSFAGVPAAEGSLGCDEFIESFFHNRLRFLIREEYTPSPTVVSRAEGIRPVGWSRYLRRSGGHPRSAR